MPEVILLFRLPDRTKTGWDPANAGNHPIFSLTRQNKNRMITVACRKSSYILAYPTEQKQDEIRSILEIILYLCLLGRATIGWDPEHTGNHPLFTLSRQIKNRMRSGECRKSSYEIIFSSFFLPAVKQFQMVNQLFRCPEHPFCVFLNHSVSPEAILTSFLYIILWLIVPLLLVRSV